MRGCERAEHLHHQAARPAQKHRILDPQRAGAWCRISGWQDPPEFCNQRRGYRPFKFAVERLELTLQPGHVLGRQRSPIHLLVSRLQQRPHAQQPIWLFYAVGRALAGRLADDDNEPPRRSGSVIARLPSACGLWLLHLARMPADGASGQGRSSRIGVVRSLTSSAIATRAPAAATMWLRTSLAQSARRFRAPARRTDASVFTRSGATLVAAC